MGWKYRVKQVLHRFIAVQKFMYYRLDRTQVRELNDATEITMASSKEVSVEDVIRDLYASSATELTFYDNYVRQGIEHWAALQNGRVAGVVWLYTGYYLAQWEGYDAWLLHIETEPTAKFVCNVFVSPQCRGQGIFPLIAQRCFSEYPDSEFYSCIASSNTPSIRSHEKVGFRQCAVAYYLRLFQITFCYFVTKTGRGSLSRGRFFRMTRGKEINVSLIDQ